MKLYLNLPHQQILAEGLEKGIAFLFQVFQVKADAPNINCFARSTRLSMTITTNARFAWLKHELSDELSLPQHPRASMAKTHTS